jgi:hypothetical protein
VLNYLSTGTTLPFFLALPLLVCEEVGADITNNIDTLKKGKL